MKQGRSSKWIAIVCLAAALLLTMPVPAQAAGSVSYRGQTEGIVFERDGAAVTELFAGFQNVMPGDSLEETVTLRNESPDGKKVMAYLKALTPESGGDFLSQLTLTVSVGTRQLGQDTAERTAKLDNWVLLDALDPGEEQTLTLRLDVPITMGNEFQEAAGALTWSFQIEEEDPKPSPSPTASPKPSQKPSPSPTTSSSKGPKTGDEARPGLYAALAALSAAGLLSIAVFTRGRKKRQ